MKSKELREKRAEIAKKMNELVLQAKNRADSPYLNSEEQEIFDRMDTEQKDYLNKAEGLERMERFESSIIETARHNPDVKRAVDTYNRLDDFDNAARGWLANKFLTNRKGCDSQFKHNVEGVANQFRDCASRTGVDYDSDTLSIQLRETAPRDISEIRTSSGQSSITSNLGAEFVPTLLANFIEIYLLAYSQVRKYARVIRTPDGGKFDIPYSDDTANYSVLIAESASDVVLDIPTNKLEISSYMYTTKEIYIPIEWSRDSKFPVMQFVADQLGVRHARGTNIALTTGTGSSQPQGFATGASTGFTTSTYKAVSYADLLGWYYSCPAAYRNTDTFAFVCSDSLVQAWRAMTDTLGRPLWEPSLQAFQPDRLLGRPVITNYHLGEMGTTSAIVGTCGDFNQYLIRDVGNFELVVDPYTRMCTNRQVIVAGHGAIDAVVLNANALQNLVTPSTSSSSGV